MQECQRCGVRAMTAPCIWCNIPLCEDCLDVYRHNCRVRQKAQALWRAVNR